MTRNVFSPEAGGFLGRVEKQIKLPKIKNSSFLPDIFMSPPQIKEERRLGTRGAVPRSQFSLQMTPARAERAV